VIRKKDVVKMYLWDRIDPPSLGYSKEVSDGLTKFGKYVYNAYYFNKYVGAIISGSFGIGKSMTALHLGREIAQAIYGVNEEQGMQIALQNTLFTIDEVLDATKNLGTVDDWRNMDPYKAHSIAASLRKPFYIWDDAGMHGSKYKHFLDMAESYDLQSNFDTIRDVTSCIIMTVPEDEELLKFLRSYRGNYSVEIIARDAEYLRHLEFWKYGKDSQGRKKKYKKWMSAPFSIHVNQPYYGQYRIMKNIAKLENFERYEKKKEDREIYTQYRMLKLKKMKEALGNKIILKNDVEEDMEVSDVEP
jgi:hypothetical protein